jgi:hypothetical protein
MSCSYIKVEGASRNEGIQEHDMLGSGCHWNPVLTFAKCGRVTNES